MHLASALLIFRIHSLNTFYREPHHGLVPDFPCQRLVVHPSDVQVSIAAVDPCIVWRSASGKSCVKPQTSVHQFSDSVVSAAGKTGMAPLMIGSMSEV